MKRMATVKAKLNRKVLTLCGVMVLLIGAVTANIIISRNKEKVPETAITGDSVSEAASAAAVQLSFFDSFRKERDTTREQEIAYIDTIIEQGADAETMADAQKQKLSIVEGMEKEMTIESLLKAKGFKEAAVTLHEGAVNVILSAEALSDEQVAQVLDIIVRETGERTENIKITTAQ
ncbi:MAG: SpoIIIAH-like family protein [Clostridia bacterium]